MLRLALILLAAMIWLLAPVIVEHPGQLPMYERIPLTVAVVGAGAYLALNWLAVCLRLLSKPFWWLMAKVLARPRVADWIISRVVARGRAFPIVKNGATAADPAAIYMGRWWIWNAEREGVPPEYWWSPISIRLHNIKRRDSDRADHDHPWPWFRSFILKNWYLESIRGRGDFDRDAGSTRLVRQGEFHRIIAVPEDGVWTLVITARRSGIWGFMTSRGFVPHDQYLKKDLV